MARRYLDRVIVTDLNMFSPTDLGRFDCVICSHILEHLYWPKQVLRAVVPLLEPGGRLFVAPPTRSFGDSGSASFGGNSDIPTVD